jgi:guanine deaminase
LSGQIAGKGVNRVVELHDPAAHAEVMALRAAGSALGRHVFEDAVLYSSSEPCPMCLAACYWACVQRVVFAATSYDVAACGLQDLAIYEELKLPPGGGPCRKMPAGMTCGAMPRRCRRTGPGSPAPSPA